MEGNGNVFRYGRKKFPKIFPRLQLSIDMDYNDDEYYASNKISFSCERMG